MVDKQSCLDPKIAFKNLDTFVNCVDLWGDRNYYSRSSIARNKDNPFVQVFDSCIAEYCQFPQSDLGGCSNRGYLDSLSDETIDIHLRSSLSALECDVVNRDVDADIAGPGVCSSALPPFPIARHEMGRN